MFNNYSPFSTYPGASSYDRINQNMPNQNFNMYNQNIPPSPQTYQQNTNITFVNGIEGAKAYQLSPNSSVILMDSDNSKFYVKSTDNLGVPKLTSYSFTEDDLSAGQNSKQELNSDLVQVNKDDFDNLIAKIGELEKFKENVESKLSELL